MEPKLHTEPTVHVVRVHQPELAPEERSRRLEHIIRAAAELVLAAERAGV